MAIELIAKVAPKNDGFTGMVDADQVLGGGGSGTLPDACVAESNVTQHEAAISHDAIADVSADDHHAESHTVASHSDTTATGAELETLTDGSDAADIHIHDARYYTEGEVDALLHAEAHTLASHTDQTLGADLVCNNFDLTGITNLESTGNIYIKPDGDADNYVYFSTAVDIPAMVFEGDGVLTSSGALTVTSTNALTLVAGGGTINVSDEMLFATTEKLQFHDTDIFIHASSDGNMAIDADTLVTIGHTGTTKIGDGATNYAQFASDGEVSLHGTARVTIDLWLSAGGIKAPGANPATFIEQGLAGAWQFDDAIEANQESIAGTLKIPSNMDRTVVPVFKVGWSANGVSPGNCEWQLEYLWVAPNQDTTGAADETLTVTSTASATSDGLIIASFSGIDLPGGSDQAMFFRITRLSAHANDTIADTVELHGRLFQYTSDKLGTAT